MTQVVFRYERGGGGCAVWDGIAHTFGVVQAIVLFVHG